MTPRVLWVTAEAPDHERGGGSIRQAHLLDGLVRAGAEVDLLLAGTLRDTTVSDAVVSVRSVPVPSRPGPRSRAARRAHDVWRVAGARLPAEVADKLAERAVLGAALRDMQAGPGFRPYDVVHVEHLGLAGLVPPGLAALRSLGVQNVPSRMAEQAGALAPGRRQRMLLAGEAAAGRRFQRRIPESTDVVAVVSAEDGRELLSTRRRSGRRPGGGAPQLLITPNGVDPDRFPPSPLPDGHRVVLTGTLDFLPNVDAACWFAREVLPLVRHHVPHTELAIVGRRPVPDVVSLSDLDGVTVHRDVPDVGPYLQAARVAVVPVRIGTGSRVKALEAMAAGRPVVGTTIGLEGIDVVAGREVLLGDTPGELAEAVVRLLTDPELAGLVAAAGRELVVSRYDWSAIADTFASGLLRGVG